MSSERMPLPGDVPAVIERASTISSVAVAQVEQAIEALRKIRAASLSVTYAEDWTSFNSGGDGPPTGYLQEKGCNRVAPLWGISFEKPDLAKDVVERTLEDGHYFVEVVVRGSSALTGTTLVETGSRSTAGFFEKAWAKAHGEGSQGELSHVAVEEVKADVRAAAWTSARGSLIRKITGLAEVPLSELAKLGLDPKKGGAVAFQSGGKGGAGGYASAAQLNLIAGEALRRRKVDGLGAAVSHDDLVKILEGANLSGGRAGQASALITKLKDAKQPLTLEAFEKELCAGGQQVEIPRPDGAKS